MDRPIEPFKLARRHDMIQRRLYHPDVMQAVNDHARRKGIPENVAFQQAKKHAREIVPSFSATVYFTVASTIAHFLSETLYRVRIGRFDAVLSGLDPKATVVFVMNYRSNMDYVLVTYLAAQRSALSYAVGAWARIWPIGLLISAMSAFFIRRKFRGLLYSRVLACYVQMATQGGVTQAVFPEGGLSLDGHIAPSRLWILNYVISGWELKGRGVTFVPVSINYDRLLKDYILLAAGKRGQRRFGANISVIAWFIGKQFWLWLAGRYQRVGYAVVHFGTPVSLSDFHKQTGAISSAVLAREIMVQVEAGIPVLPDPLISLILVNNAPLRAMKLNAAFAAVKPEYLQNTPVAWAEAAEVAVLNLVQRKLIVHEAGRYIITEKGKSVLTYYAACLSHILKN
ncbi:1-acyl-sn-glycerol-3-phosphate acyltransferase [Planktomarina sp.]|nr:1-acyl-sn-glycerol-3-phosphate acyltransferase [Planktomarina sp.]